VELVWDKHYRNGRLSSSTVPKGSFWWRDALKLLDKYRQVWCCLVGRHAYSGMIFGMVK